MAAHLFHVWDMKLYVREADIPGWVLLDEETRKDLRYDARRFKWRDGYGWLFVLLAFAMVNFVEWMSPGSSRSAVGQLVQLPVIIIVGRILHLNRLAHCVDKRTTGEDVPI